MAPNRSNNNNRSNSNRSNNNRLNNNNNNNDNGVENIRGPTSALSEFLREQGIRIPNRSRREMRERRQELERQQQQENNDTTNTSDATGNASAATINSPETTTTTITVEATSDSNNNNKMNENTTSILYTPVTTRVKRARNADAQSIINTAASTSKKAQQQKKKKMLLSKRKRKSKKGDDSSDSSSDSDSSDFSNSTYGDDDDDTFKPGPSRRSQVNRSIVSFCHKCKNRFTRPRSDHHDNLQDSKPTCPTCLSGKIKPPSAKRKRINAQGAADSKVEFNKEVRGVPPLKNICIELVMDYLEDIEAFGDIGSINLDKLAKIVCRNRSLNNNIARLFLQPNLRELSLYDCTNMDIDGLKNIAHFCPNLQILNLNYCGRINNDVLQLYKTHLPHLKSLSLGGAHLITHEAWIDFFKARGHQLETFHLRHSYWFQKDTFKELLLHAKGLKHLRLSRIVTMDNDFLNIFVEHGPTTLQTLDLSWPSEAPEKKHILTSEHMVRVLERTGSQLKELVLRGCQDMTDELLLDGVLPHCNQLQHLVLEQCNQFTSDGFKRLFVHWKIFPSREHGCGLKHITISRCTQLEDDAFIALLCHSWKSLTHLNIHSLEFLSSNALEVIAGSPVPDLTPFEEVVDDDVDNDDNDDSRNNGTDNRDSEQEQQENSNNNNTNSNDNDDSNNNNSNSNDDSDNDKVQSPSKNQKRKPVIIDKDMLASLSACSSLTYLDASFVRSMDDFVLQKLIKACPLLKNILVWGCPQVSDVQVPIEVTLEGREMCRIIF